MDKLQQFQEEVLKYKDTRKVSDEITFARNSKDEFYRILRKSWGGQNANIETYNQKFDYKGNVVTLEYFRNQFNELKNNPEFRFRRKDDRQKTNISDSPGFGSVRLSPPYEDDTFDKEYFEFLDTLVNENDSVVDFGGGMSPFLAFLSKGKKKLVDKSGISDIVAPFGIEYEDADEWLKNFTNPDVLFCFHTLEHTENPEELVTLFSKAGVFVFATPNEEVINTSIYHHIFMQTEIFKKIFEKNQFIAFMRISKHSPLDIHGIVINSIPKWNQIKNNIFFRQNFKLYKEV